jgi:cellulose synthase/poly-beta-1,6-N-acetylglucosamine synthase-like glycosyltransferase
MVPCAPVRMRLPLSLLLVIPATLAACDALVRVVLWSRGGRPAGGRRNGRRGAGTTPKLLIVVPARAEGDRLQATLKSTKGADVLLLLDGDDPGVNAHGARVVVKTPAGPSKAAALAWLAREQRALIETYDAVLILDAGSRLSPDFFEHFDWPEDATAVQTFLHGSSEGVGAAAAESERVAQESEDRGREALGWNVRLRGTGSAFTSQAFLELMPRLDTRIEDLEATLLLTATGDRIRMTEAVVLDEKPEAMTAAASQRARWFLGRYELLVRRAPAFAEVIAKRPLEGAAFLVEIFGRPLSLTAPLRVAAAILLMRHRQPVFGGILALSAAADVALHTKANPAAVLRLGGSWLMALLMAPRALVRWMRP